jgi:DNA polymerase III delta subunit
VKRAVAAIKEIRTKARAKLPAILVLGGQEEFLRAEVREAYVAKLGEDVDIVPFDPDGHDDVSIALLDELRTGSLFSSNKVVLISEASALMSAAKDAFASLAKAAPEACLVLEDPKFVSRKGRKIVVPKAIEALGEGGAMIVDCEPLASSPYGFGKPAWDHELAKWVAQRAQGAGKKMDASVAHEIATRVGTGLRGIASELDKLVVQVGDAPAIRMRDVESAIASGEDATIFELVDAFGARDLSAVLEASKQLFERGVKDEKGQRTFRAPEIVARTLPLLARRLRELGRLTEITRRGGDFEDAVTQVLGRGRSWLGRKLKPQLDARSPRELGGAVVALCELERGLKSSGGHPRDLLMLFLVNHARPREAIATAKTAGISRGPFSGRRRPQ